jgi:hypothetical protein
MIFIYEESLRSSYINIIFVKGIKEKVESVSQPLFVLFVLKKVQRHVVAIER